MFRVRLAGPKKSSDPTSDSGIPKVTQNATRRSNTRTRQMKTSTAPMTPFRTMLENRSKIGDTRSFQISMVMSWGASHVESQALISSAMSTMDCPSAASTRTKTAGLPSNRETTSSSTKPSRTSAMSPRVTIVPSRRVMSGMSSNSLPARRLPTVCRTTPPASVRSSPNVRFSEARRTALATRLMVRSLRRSSSSLSSIDISRSRVPSSVTREMEGRPSSPSRSSSAASRNSFSPATEDETAIVMTSRSRRSVHLDRCGPVYDPQPRGRTDEFGRPHQLADRDVGAHHPDVERQGNARALEPEPCKTEGNPGLHDLRFRLLDRRSVASEVRHFLSRMRERERLRRLPPPRRLDPHPGPGLPERVFRRLDLELVLGRVDPDERLLRRERPTIPELGRNPDHPPDDLGGDPDPPVHSDRPRQLDGQGRLDRHRPDHADGGTRPLVGERSDATPRTTRSGARAK